MIIADTDVLIDALNGIEPVRTRIDRELQGERLATTVINVFELVSGLRKESDRAKAERLLQGLRVLPMDEAACRRAAMVRRELEGNGTPIGFADYLIAGACLTRSATLLTRNRKHFARVRDLALEKLEP